LLWDIREIPDRVGDDDKDEDARSEPGMTNKTSITKEAKRTIKPGMTDSMLINAGKAQDPTDS